MDTSLPNRPLIQSAKPHHSLTQAWGDVPCPILTEVGVPDSALIGKWAAVPAVAVLMLSRRAAGAWRGAPQQPEPAITSPRTTTRPEPVRRFTLGRTLHDGPRAARPAHVQRPDGQRLAAAARQEGIWVLDFAFKPLRIRTVDIPGKGRRQVHYLYYRVVNRTGTPRMFVPQFIMVNEKQEAVRGRGHPAGDPARSRAARTPRSRSSAR